jgi:hypothetical protein
VRDTHTRAISIACGAINELNRDAIQFRQIISLYPCPSVSICGENIVFYGFELSIIGFFSPFFFQAQRSSLVHQFSFAPRPHEPLFFTQALLLTFLLFVIKIKA